MISVLVFESLYMYICGGFNCSFVCVIGLCSGHGSFSNNSKLNSVVGHLLHSSILVPYHGWYVVCTDD